MFTRYFRWLARQTSKIEDHYRQLKPVPLTDVRPIVLFLSAFLVVPFVGTVMLLLTLPIQFHVKYILAMGFIVTVIILSIRYIIILLRRGSRIL